MKNNILLISSSTSTALFAQVGINTETPKPTLDVIGLPAVNLNWMESLFQELDN